eukprot:5958873-Pyramimonas_sp.AAC.1
MSQHLGSRGPRRQLTTPCGRPVSLSAARISGATLSGIARPRGSAISPACHARAGSAAWPTAARRPCSSDGPARIA